MGLFTLVPVAFLSALALLIALSLLVTHDRGKAVTKVG